MSYLILLVHFATDWWLQPRAVARRKSSSLPWMFRHLGVIFCGTFLLGMLSFWKIEHGIVFDAIRAGVFAIFYTAVHGAQDGIIWGGYELLRGHYTEDYLFHNRYAEDYWWYFTIALDQLLHLGLLFWMFA